MSADDPGRWTFDAIGTGWEIVTTATLDASVRADVSAAIASFDREWSRFRDDSLVAELASGVGSVRAPTDAAAMLEVYAELHAATEGAVTPLIGDSLTALGYGADITLVASAPVPAPAGATSLHLDGDRLALDGAATIDVGAIGKGRLVDIVLDVVRSRVQGDVIVDASGDLAVRGGPVRIGLEHPYDPARAIGVVTATDEALCASAANRRAWGDGLHHVLDGRTGLPVHTVVATWAIAATAMIADATATALFFEGGPRYAFEHGVRWVRMLSDGRVEYSPGAEVELFR